MQGKIEGLFAAVDQVTKTLVFVTNRLNKNDAKIMKKPIISIDWDHTFRNMHGLDLNLLSLVCYSKAKGIPVGLTTHRDIENTTLYSLYHWQFKKPENNKIALAAAINYWQE